MKRLLLCLVILSSGCAEKIIEEFPGGDSGSFTNGNDAGVDDPNSVPVSPQALFGYLKAGKYKNFAKESSVHDSTNGSPHGKVRVYINDLLAASLAAKKSSHPSGSAAVKELYEGDGTTLDGWAVSVKTEADSAEGNNWYWYEIFNTTDGSNPASHTLGSAACVGCHQSGGTDLFQSHYPLR